MFAFFALKAGKDAHANVYEFLSVCNVTPNACCCLCPMLALVFTHLLPPLRLLLCVPLMDQSMSLLLIMVVVLLLFLH